MSQFAPNSAQSLFYGAPQRQPYGTDEGVQPMQAQKRLFNPKSVFMGTGILLLMMLCVVPLWNALALMSDPNYTFWAGTAVPIWIVVLCISIVVLYCVTIMIFFSTARPQVQTEQTIMMIANIFITLLGLVLMLVSMPLSRQAVDTYTNLMYRCDYSEMTHRMYEYSQVLHNIRRTPECAERYSVEECAGYEDAQPYTGFLKNMENSLRCSGFCYRAPGQEVSSTAGMSLASLARGDRAPAAGRKARHQDAMTPLALTASAAEAARQLPQGFGSAAQAASKYPPTLFSDANYQASCEGMAARDMKNFAGDVGFQTFYQGIYLVLIAIATGFLKLIGFCIRKDEFKASRTF